MKPVRTLTILVVFSMGIPLFSQTLAMEYDTMLNKYIAKQYTQLEFKDLSFAWRNLIDSVGYPQVPYDSVSKKVEYEFVSTLDGVSREIIVNRISEWGAISFGSTNALLTQQGDVSRLILNGSFKLFFPDLFPIYKNAWRGYVETELQNSGICYFTLVFTIRDGKMKNRVLNLSYEYTDFLSDRTISRTLNSCFPISSKEQDEWKAIIGLVNETTESLNAMNDQVTGYILQYEMDYNW